MRTLELNLPDACDSIAMAGGPYSNFAAVAAFVERTAGIEHRFCLGDIGDIGDIGGFGPLPDRTLDLIRASGIVCLQGNYDHAIGHGESDCGCGYIDPIDRHYAQVSYDYTERNTSAHPKAFLRELPERIVLAWRAERLPDVFIDSLLHGRWTTCCNILPADERMPRDRLAALQD